MTPEGKVKKKVTDLFRRYGVWYFFPANNGFGKSGIPDVIAIVRGIFVGIECKADHTRKPTELQLWQGTKIKKAGGMWFLVYDDVSLRLVEQYIARALTKGKFVENK